MRKNDRSSTRCRNGSNDRNRSSSSKSESKETTKSTTEAAKDTEVESTSDQKTFTVGFDAEFPPYGYRDENGEYVALTLSAEEVA